MSIVDDALHKLGQADHAAGLETGSSVADKLQASSVAHQLYLGRSPARQGKPWLLIGALALLGMGAFTWWSMDRLASKVPAPAVASSSSSSALPPTAALVPPAPAPLVAPIPAAPVVVAAASPAQPVAAALPPVTLTATPIVRPVSEPPNVAPAAAPKTTTVVPAPAPAAPAVTVAAPAKLAVATPSAPAASMAATSANTAASAALPPVSRPEWLNQGWQLADQGHNDQALEVWRAGLGQLQGNRLAVYAHAYYSLPMALAQARRLGASAATLVLPETVGQRLQYRVLLLGDAQVTALAIKNSLAAQAPYLWVAPPRVASNPRDAAPTVSLTLPAATATVAAPAAPAAQPDGSGDTPPPAPAAAPAHTTAAAAASTAKVKPTASKPAVAAAPEVAASGSQQVEFSVNNTASRVLDTFARGDIAESLRLATQLVASQPERWEGHFVQGAALLASGRALEAEAPLERALSLNPNSDRVLLQRAIAAQEVGQPARAVGWLRRALAIAPDNTTVLLNLGYSAELSGASADAVAAYQRYLQLTNGHNGVQTQRAYVTERLRILGKQ